MNRALAVHPVPLRAARRQEREARQELVLQPERPIRFANPDEFPYVMDRLREAHAENGQHAWSERKIASIVLRALTKDYGLIATVGEADDIRALIVMLIDQVYYSEDRQIIELINYVRPDSRRSPYGRRLLEFAMCLSDMTGI